MKTTATTTLATRMLSVLLAGVALLTEPTALWAHPGHGWLAGAAQPLTALDHFLAAMFVMVVVGIGVSLVARAGRLGDGARRRERSSR